MNDHHSASIKYIYIYSQKDAESGSRRLEMISKKTYVEVSRSPIYDPGMQQTNVISLNMCRFRWLYTYIQGCSLLQPNMGKLKSPGW